MNNLLAILIGLILSSGRETLHSSFVQFSKMPPECAARYEPELKKQRQSKGTDIIYCDIDCDGKREMLVYTGNSGSGGESWSVMMQTKHKWSYTGEVFGTQYYRVNKHPYHGLLVSTPGGWDYAVWNYYELQNEQLICRLRLHVAYFPPEGHVLRSQVREIKVEIPDHERINQDKNNCTSD